MALPLTTQATFSSPLRRLRSICLLMVLGLLATSCYSVDANVVVNEDGSGSFAIEYIIDKDTSEASLIAGDLVSACDAVTVMQNAAPNGSLFTPLDSSSQCGARITMDFANETELRTGMQTISDRSRFASFGYFPEILISRGETEGSWNFQSQFKPPLPANLEDQADFRSEVAGGSFVISVDLPGRQVEHNADRIDENGVMIFEVNPLVDPSGQIFVQTEPGVKILGVSDQGGFMSSTMIFALVLIAALVGAYFIVKRSKKRRQYEGYDDDDDGTMISASERLGLGSYDATPDPDAVQATSPENATLADTGPAAESAFAESVFAEPVVAEPVVAETPVDASAQLFSDSAEPQAGSWPVEEPAVAPSPVFDSVDEPSEPQSWVTGTQAIESQPTTNAMADWPSAQPEAVLAPSGAMAEMQPAMVEPAAAAGEWPTTPLVASGAAPTPPQSVIVDHSNDSISSVPAGGDFSAMQPAPVAPETNGWPTAEVPTALAPAAESFGTSDMAPLESGAPFTAESSLAAPAWPTAAPVAQAPAVPAPAPAEAVAPVPVVSAAEPATPVAAASAAPVSAAPTQADMVWDEQRKAYVVFDHRRGAWMTFDDATQSWISIS